MALLLVFPSPTSGALVALKEDDRAAFAYLVESEQVVGFTWLYNVGAITGGSLGSTPQNAPPFASATRTLPRLGGTTRMRCEWRHPNVEIYLDDVLAARLWRGARPGASHLVDRPGPIGLPLV